MISIEQWLQGLELEQYAEIFAREDIEADVLPDLTEKDLQNIGVTLGHRKRIMKAIALLEQENTTPQNLPSIATPQQSSAEFRQISAVFCDLCDSVKLSRTLGTETMHEINSEFHRLTRDSMQEFGGYIARYIGDAVLCYFGFPHAKEDDAERAILAGLKVLERVKKWSSMNQSAGEDALAARIAIATSSVIIESIGEGASWQNTAVGDAPNLAARLQGHAQRNSLIVDAQTLELARTSFDHTALPPLSLKGFEKPVTPYQINNRLAQEAFKTEDSSAKPVVLVNRVEEKQLLFSRWERTLTGDGQAVLVTGEAGIGKSRLIKAFLGEATKGQVKLIRYFGSSIHANTLLHPVLDRITRDCEIDDTDSETEKREKLRNVMSGQYGLDIISIDALAAIMSIGNSDTQQENNLAVEELLEHLQEALCNSLDRMCEQHPTVVLVEDAHWMDPTTLGYIRLLIERSEQYRRLVIVTSRPTNEPVLLFGNLTRLSLNRMSDDHIQEMITQLGGNTPIDNQMGLAICQKSNGIPLFAEELAKMVVATKQSELSTELKVESTETVIPDSLRGSLLARLDTLGSAKEIAQVASIVGRGFTMAILAHITGKAEELINAIVVQLVHHEVFAKISSQGDGRYDYKHALLRDAAYESLLLAHRRKLHLKIANYYRDLPDSYGVLPELIAHHYMAADDKTNAMQFWFQSGMHALESGATREACDLLDFAESCYNDIENVELKDAFKLLLNRGKAHSAAYGAASNEATQSFERAYLVAKKLDDILLMVDALDYQFGIIFNAGKLKQSLQPAKLMIELGKSSGNLSALVSGLQVLGMALFNLGEFGRCKKALNEALLHRDNEEVAVNCYPSMTLSYLSLAEFILGNPEKSRACMEDSLQSSQSESTYSEATALSNSCYTAHFLGEYDLIDQLSTKLIDLADQTGQKMYHKRGQFFYHLANAYLNDNNESLVFLSDALNDLVESGEEVEMSYLMGILADLLFRQSNYEQAQQTVTMAMTLAEKNDESFYQCELFRLQAKIFADRANDVEARTFLNKSRDLAVSQNALGWLANIETLQTEFPAGKSA